MEFLIFFVFIINFGFIKAQIPSSSSSSSLETSSQTIIPTETNPTATFPLAPPPAVAPPPVTPRPVSPRPVSPRPEIFPLESAPIPVKSVFIIEISNGITEKIILERSRYLSTSNANRQEYQIINVVGYSGRRRVGGITAPTGCNGIIANTVPGNLFCMDKPSGDIYATKQKNNIYVGQQTYNLTIKWNSGALKSNTATYNITINFTDKCSSVSKEYYKLKDTSNPCTSYLVSSQPPPTRKIPNFHKVLGFRIQSKLLLRRKGEFILRITLSNKINFDFDIKTTNNNNADHFDVDTYSLNEFEIGDISKSSIQIISIDKDQENIIAHKDGDVSIYTSNTWSSCQSINCVIVYKAWKQAISQTTDPSCIKDDYFARTYYERCTNLNPVFTSAPTFTNGFIRGCAYDSITELSQFTGNSYLLINGIKKTDGFFTPARRKKRSTDEKLTSFNFMDFQIMEYDHVGEIKCVLFDRDRMSAPVISNSTFVKYKPPIFMPMRYKSPVNVRAGDSFALQGCSFNSPLNLRAGEAFWLKDGQHFRNASVNNNNKFQDLILPDLTLNDSGIYMCAIKAGSFAQITYAPVNLTVTEISISVSQPQVVRRVGKSNGGLAVQGCAVYFTDWPVFDQFMYYELTNIHGDITKIAQPKRIQQRKRRAVGFSEFQPLPIESFKDFGEYRCVVYNPTRMLAPKKSRSTNTNAFSPIFMPTNFTSPVIVRAGERFTLQGCSFNSSLNLKAGEAFWLKDGQHFRNASVTNNKFQDLILPDLTLNDSGVYMCVIKAGSFAQITYAPVNLTVKATTVGISPPQVVRQVGTSNGGLAVQGCIVYFTVSSSVSDEFIYYELTNINGDITKIAQPKPIPLRKRRAQGLSRLQPLPIESFKDFGEYRCVVYDPARMLAPKKSRSTNTNAFLPQIEDLIITQKKSYFSGEQLMFTCTINSFFTDMDAYWVKNDVKYQNGLITPPRPGLTTMYPYNVNLLIKMVNVNDSGLYACAYFIPNVTLSARKSNATRITVKYLEVKFTSKPVLQIARNDFRLVGCDFTTSILINNIAQNTYILLNGTRVNRTQITDSNIQQARKRRETIGFFPSFQIQTYLGGFYQCVVFNKTLMKEPVVSNATFIKPPAPQFDLQYQPKNVTVIAGVSFKLCECPLRQLSIQPKEGKYFFLKDGFIKIPFPIPSVDEELVDNECRGKLISYSKIQDGGSYQCVFEPFGLAAIQSTKWFIKVEAIIVNFQPSVLQLDVDGVVFSGCPFTSNMRFTKSMEHTLVYLQITNANGTRNMTTKVNQQFRNNYTTTSFMIDSFENFGTYVCVVSDPGLTNKLIVSAEAKFNHSSFPDFHFPKLIKDPEPSLDNATLPVGTAFRIKGCRFQSSFRKGFNAYWLKDEKFFAQAEIQTANNISGVLIFKDLVFDPLTPENNGSYKCVIDLPGNPIQLSTPVVISLEEMEAVFESPPKWNVSDERVDVIGCKYHSATDLTNHAFLLFNGTVKISFSQEPMKMEQGNYVGNGLFEYEVPGIRITSFEQLGRYQCVIENELLREKKIMSKSLQLNTLKVASILPKFTNQPKATYASKTGGNLLISEGRIHSKIPLPDSSVFLLKNGVSRFTPNPEEETKEKRVPSFPREPLLPDIQDLLNKNNDPSRRRFSKFKTTHNDQGFYQFGIKLFGIFEREILSEVVNVQFIDVASAEIEVRMDRKWDERLSDVTTKLYKDLEQKLVKEMENTLPLENGSKPTVRVLKFRKGSVVSDIQILYPNVTNDVRMEKCNSFQTLEGNSKLSPDLHVKEMKITSLDCCDEDTEGEQSFKGIETFPVTLVSTTHSNNCTYTKTTVASSATSKRLCIGNLKDGPQWSEVNLKNCPAKSEVTNDLINLSTITLCVNETSRDCQTPIEVTSNLTKIVDEPEKVTTRQDLDYISTILKTISIHPTAFPVNDTVAAKIVIDNVLEVVSTIMTSDKSIFAEAQQKTQASASILVSLDVMAERLGNIVKASPTNATIQINKPNIAFKIKYSPPIYLEVIGKNEHNSSNLEVTFVDIDNDDTVMTSAKNNKSEILISSKVSKEAFANNSQAVYSYLFNSDTLFQTEKQLRAQASGQVPTSPVVSNVLDVTVGDTPVVNLTDPIFFVFKKIESYAKGQCTFWNPNFPTSFKNARGRWMTNGCDKVNETNEQITCKCNHLTNFAIILDVSQSESNPLELQIITWIGCGVSMAGLVFTLFTYIFIKKLRRKLPPKILMSLSFSLLVLLIVFLVGVERETTNSKESCQVVAGILHYFMLSTFCWMLIEAVNLYRNFVKIFGGGSDGKFLTKASIFAWGVPLVIVVVNGAVKPDNLGNDTFCVVVGYSFYFALLLPVALILLINFIVLVLVMKSLNKSSASMITDQKKSLTRQARIAFACATLLGLTWVLALFAVSDLQYTFQLLFTIFNSLQGFFIFVFYTILNRDVQKECKRLLKGSDDDHQKYSNTYSNSVPVNITLDRKAINKAENASTNGKTNKGYEMADLVSNNR